MSLSTSLNRYYLLIVLVTFTLENVNENFYNCIIFHSKSVFKNRNRSEGKLGLELFFTFLRRIVALFDEKKWKIAQIQFFYSRFSILGQASRTNS